MRNRILFVVLLSLWGIFAGCSKDNGGGNEEPGYKFYDTPFANVPDADRAIVYQVNERIFAASNSLNAVAARLDHIKSLGTNVIWLMPVTEQGELKAFGSPYCVKDYKKTEPEYGTLDDLRNLVKQAHAKDIAVIVDWVANHTAWDNAWISNKSWYTQDGNGNIISPAGTGWNDVADLNYDNSDMRKAMIEAMKYWIVEANVDGFRCDAADMVPSSFWAEAIAGLRSMQSGRTILMLAEGTGVANLSAGFDMDYGWEFCGAIEDLYSDKVTISALYNKNKAEYDAIPAKKQKMRFITNHDRAAENSPITIFKGQQGALSAFVITSMLYGSPMIYSSQEIGYPDKLSFFTSTAVDWNSNPSVLAEYKKIMQICSTSPAIIEGRYQTFDNNPDIVHFYRLSDSDAVYVAVNVRGEAKTLTVPSQFVGIAWKNLMDNTNITMPQTLQLEPYQYLIFGK